MLVFLDTLNQIIKVYSDKGVRVIPFIQTDIIKSILGNNKVMYITKAINTDASQVIALIKNIIAQNREITESSQEDLYIRYIGKKALGGVLEIAKDIKFTGLKDFKLLKDLEQYGFEKMAITKKLLQEGLLQIVTESEKQRIVDDLEEKIATDIVSQKEKAIRKKEQHEDAIEINLENVVATRNSSMLPNEGTILPEE